MDAKERVPHLRRHGLLSSGAKRAPQADGNAGARQGQRLDEPATGRQKVHARSCVYVAQQAHLSVNSEAAATAEINDPQTRNHKRHSYNSHRAPPSGWSGGGMVLPWYYPGPIEPSQSPIFDQASLFSLPACGFSAVKRFSGQFEVPV